MKLNPLRDLVRQDPMAAAILLEIATRGRNRLELDVSRLAYVMRKHHPSLSTPKAREVFGKLSALGAGHFVSSNRYRFNVMMTDMAKWALGEDVVVRPAKFRGMRSMKKLLSNLKKPSLPAPDKAPKVAAITVSNGPAPRLLIRKGEVEIETSIEGLGDPRVADFLRSLGQRA